MYFVLKENLLFFARILKVLSSLRFDDALGTSGTMLVCGLQYT